MKVADYIIQRLAEAGIDKMFVVYGAANGDLIDAFTRTDKTSYVAVLHEQAGGFSAEAYSRVSGKFGVAIATSGPGGMNLVTPIGNCYYDSIPCLFITGQPNSKFLRKSTSIRQNAFQETDIVSIVKPITKYAVMVKSVSEVAYELDKCIHIMLTGQQGPCLLDIPLDVQKAEMPDIVLGYFPALSQQSSSDTQQNAFVEEYLADLSKAKRPVVIVGGGARGAKEKVRAFITALGVPAFPTWNALDVITSDFPYYGGRIGTYGGDGRNIAIQNSDLLLALGTRLSGRIYGGVPSSFMRSAKKYVVNIDDGIFKEHDVKFDRTLQCDIIPFLERVCRKTIPSTNMWEQWMQQVDRWKHQYSVMKSEYALQIEPVHPYVFAKVLSKECNEHDIIVTDCGGNVVVMNQAFETKYGQQFFSNNGNSPMGFSFAASIGAWFANKNPKGRVICVIGDGGMNMNIQELQTLVNYGVGVKVFLMNNHIYGITKAFQETNFQGRCEACGPIGYHPPNFRAVARAYGIRADYLFLNNIKIMSSVIKSVLETPQDKPVICDVNCHEFHEYQPRIFGWNTPIEDMYPYIHRDELLGNMVVPLAEGYDYRNPHYPDVVKSNVQTGE